MKVYNNKLDFVQALIEKNKDAWYQFNKQYSDFIEMSIQQVINKNVGNHTRGLSMVEDVRQEIMLKILKNDCKHLKLISEKKKSMAIKAFLFTIIRSVTIDFFKIPKWTRTEKERGNIDLSTLDVHTKIGQPDEELQRKILRQKINSFVKLHFTVLERKVMRLYFLEGLKGAQINEKLSIKNAYGIITKVRNVFKENKEFFLK
jgi:RNA polymerase sigma factor (sigma-70 family)